jgi:hypothetical protein
MIEKVGTDDIAEPKKKKKNSLALPEQLNQMKQSRVVAQTIRMALFH